MYLTPPFHKKYPTMLSILYTSIKENCTFVAEKGNYADFY